MPHFALTCTNLGPVINVFVGVTSARREALIAAGHEIPAVVVARMLVDTGASCTCIDPHIINQLGIQPTGVSTIQTPSTQGAPVNCSQYDVILAIPGANNSDLKVFDPIPIVETQLRSQGIDGLLGRDALADCLMVYDGSNSLFTLAF
jgi:Aspartyl protease